jgi:hypothetical protein
MAGLYAAVPDIVSQLRPNARLTAAERFNCYRTSLLGRLSDALQAVYPVCSRLVGTEYFEALSTRYIKTHPSTSVNVHEYGAAWAEFLATFSPLQNYPYLPDVARLEWVWHRVFYAADEEPLDIVALTHLQPTAQTSLKFKLPAAAQLLSSDYPIQRIWQVNQLDYLGEPAVDLSEGGVRLLVWRQGYSLRMDVLSEAEWVWLSEIRVGVRFSSLCEQLATRYPNWNIPALASQCVAKGYVNGFVVEE